MIVGTRSAEHTLRSPVGIGSESPCLLGQLNKILEDFRCRSVFIVCQRRRDYHKMKSLSWSNITFRTQESDSGSGYEEILK